MLDGVNNTVRRTELASVASVSTNRSISSLSLSVIVGSFGSPLLLGLMICSALVLASRRILDARVFSPSESSLSSSLGLFGVGTGCGMHENLG